MSLACHECGKFLFYSETLPGGEGTMVQPVLQSLIWKQSEVGQVWVMAFIPVDYQSSLCLQCIAGKMPRNRRPLLSRFYEAYEAETRLIEITHEQTGKWVAISDNSFSKAHDAFAELGSIFRRKECLFCGGNVYHEKRPFFRCNTLDRVYCRRHTSGLFPGEANYSWSNMTVGALFFYSCFSCFRKYFPKSYREISKDLRGDKNPEASVADEFTPNPTALESLREYCGRENDDDYAPGRP